MWGTKYRFQVLEVVIKLNCRDFFIQVFQVKCVIVFKRVVSKHHIHIEYCPNKNISTFIELFKGRSSRKLHVEFHELKQRYLECFWIMNPLTQNSVHK